jgi:fimbrial chaperone protein
MGDAKPKSELAYRIIAEQLPVSLTKEDRGAKINLVVRYIGSVYVVPKGVKPDVVLESVSEEPVVGDAVHKLAIVLRNQGTAHALLDNLEVDVKADGAGGEGKTSVHLTQADLKGIDSENILAGHTRRFAIPWPQGLGRGALELKFKFDQPK